MVFTRYPFKLEPCWQRKTRLVVSIYYCSRYFLSPIEPLGASHGTDGNDSYNLDSEVIDSN